MPRHQSTTISTRSIDVAAFVAAVTGTDPEIVFAGTMASFAFSSTTATRDALISYECGGPCEARKLLEIRGQLFRRIKGGRQ